MPVSRPFVLLVISAGGLFGTAGTAAALGPAGTTPIGVGILRIEIGALALLAAMPLLGASPRRLILLWRTPAMLVTAFCAGAYQLCFFAGVSRVGVALGTLVAVGSAPIAAGLVGWLALRHRPTIGWLLATTVCIVGLGLLTAADIVAGGDWLGLFLALAAGMCIAGYNVAAKFQLNRGASAIEVPAASFALGGLALLPILATQPLGWLAQPAGAALALYLGTATMGLANFLLARGMRGITPGSATTLMLADPAVATILGVVVLGEVLSTGQAFGMVLVLIGLGLEGFVATREAALQVPNAAVAAEPRVLLNPTGD